MRDLTGGVAALRDGFAKEGRDRAAAIRARLLAYAFHRREAIAVWREYLSGGRAAVAGRREAAQRPAAELRGADRPWSEPAPAAEAAPVSPEPPAPPSLMGETYEAAAAPASDAAVRSGRRPSGALGHRGSAARHGRDSK